MENMQIELTRDSVCMADDMDDHTKTINIGSQHTMHSTIMDIAKKYLPSIAGYGHSWDCLLNGRKIAVIHGNCEKITPLTDAVFFSEGSRLFFKYHSSTF